MLELQRYLIKEQVAFLKTVDTYDIYDPDTQVKVGVARETVPGWMQFLRLLISKTLMPTTVEVREVDEDSLVFRIRRPVRFFRSRVEVFDADDDLVGYFQSKILSWTAGFWVYDKNDHQLAELKGDWLSWSFRFLSPDGREIGLVTKKWAGLGKELFTSADNYLVSISDDLSQNPIAKMLLLAAALAADIVLKETRQ
jgi:uncharacterized protein YxjI